MAGIAEQTARRRLGIATAMALVLSLAISGSSVAAPGQSDLARVRAATAPFHDPAAAEAAGYGIFYVCTAQPGEGAMGQHFVNHEAVMDTVLDPTLPEALVYEPKANGAYRLVAVEYLVFADGWDAAHDGPPHLFGHDFGLVASPNRYGLPAFYELHAWIWQPNPSGMFYEWNPRVSCGD